MAELVTFGLQSIGGASGLDAPVRPDLPRRAEWLFFLKCYASNGGAPSLADSPAGPVDRAGTAGNGIADICFRRLHHALGITLRPGHRIDVLRNGAEIVPAILESIQSATRSIEFLFFVFWRGEFADRVCSALIERAEAGVRVRVLLDGVGSKPMASATRRRLRDSAVELRYFHPVPHWKFWGTAARTHRRVLVIDGECGMTGGAGIAEQWVGDPERTGSFRDTHFEIRGPAVAELRAAFFQNWAEAGGRLPEPLDVPADIGALPHQAGGSRSRDRAAVVAGRGTACWTEIALLFQLLVSEARTTLDIVTPYFVPGRALASDLAAAARRGVRVRIMLSGRQTDHRLPRWAAHRYYQDLLDAGVELFEYDGTLLHTKAVIVDRQLVCVGSQNMNQRSMSLDDEVALLADDRELADELLKDFEIDRARCRAIDPDTWNDRGVPSRLREGWAALFQAQL